MAEALNPKALKSGFPKLATTTTTKHNWGIYCLFEGARLESTIRNH